MITAPEAVLRRHGATFTRFALVGVANTLLDVGAFVLLYQGFHVFYLLAQAAAYLFGAANSYIFNKLWTFRSRRRRWGGEAARFALVNLASLGVSLLGLYLVAGALGAGVGPGKFAATAAGVLVNYAGDRFWVFPGASPTPPARGTPAAQRATPPRLR